MATIVDTAIQTSIDMAPARRPPSASLQRMYKGKTTEQAVNSTPARMRDTKYRHFFATHSLQRTSCLSHDAQESPSLVGFRNLMVLVLSAHSSIALCGAILIVSQSSQTCD